MLSGMYIKLIGAALIAAAVIGGYLYVSNLQDKVETLTTQKAALEGQIVTQNAAIDAWKRDADERLAAGAAALELAKAETVKAKAKATIIYKWKPSTPEDACKSALDLVNGVTP